MASTVPIPTSGPPGITELILLPLTGVSWLPEWMFIPFEVTSNPHFEVRGPRHRWSCAAVGRGSDVELKFRLGFSTYKPGFLTRMLHGVA